MNITSSVQPGKSTKRRVATAVVGAIALGLPLAASAQDTPMPATSFHEITTPQLIPMPTQKEQLNRLERLGFVSANQLFIAKVTPSARASNTFSQANLGTALDRVMVNTPNSGSAPLTLREYLESTGVSPDSIVGVHVEDGGLVLITYT